MRKQIAAANWKMNLKWSDGQQLLDTIINTEYNLKETHQVIFAVPFPYLMSAQKLISGKNKFAIAAQNCYNKKSGAYTGEVSAEMLQSINISYTVLGHSERREYFNESNRFLAEKTDLCLQYNIQPIFCCGEPLAIREDNYQNEYVAKQLEESLYHLSVNDIMKVIIAYEPIWAIGTGKTATAAQAQEMHHFIRNELAKKYNTETADDISVLYGGSVKASNAVEIFSQPDVDGGLVGGASLIADEFVSIIKALK